MAFSAQTDHGQSDRKEGVLCGSNQGTLKVKATVGFLRLNFPCVFGFICLKYTFAEGLTIISHI